LHYYTHKQQSIRKKKLGRIKRQWKQNNQENLQNKFKSFSKNPLSSMNILFYLIIIFWDVRKSFKFLGFKSHPTLTSISHFFTMSIKGSKFLISNLDRHKFIIIPATLKILILIHKPTMPNI
jgi:hypothetical protein